jgi:hypothetical protein
VCGVVKFGDVRVGVARMVVRVDVIGWWASGWGTVGLYPLKYSIYRGFSPGDVHHPPQLPSPQDKTGPCPHSCSGSTPGNCMCLGYRNQHIATDAVVVDGQARWRGGGFSSLYHCEKVDSSSSLNARECRGCMMVLIGEGGGELSIAIWCDIMLATTLSAHVDWPLPFLTWVMFVK